MKRNDNSDRWIDGIATLFEQQSRQKTTADQLFTEFLGRPDGADRRRPPSARYIPQQPSRPLRSDSIDLLAEPWACHFGRFDLEPSNQTPRPARPGFPPSVLELEFMQQCSSAVRLRGGDRICCEGEMIGMDRVTLRSSINPAHCGLLAGAQPVRRRLNHVRALSWDGHFASTKAIGPAPYDSFLKRDFQTLISVDPNIKQYAVESHELTYWLPGPGGDPVQRRYIPDVVAQDQEDRVLVFEVRPAFLAKQANWVEREPYIRAAYERDHGTEFVVLSEKEIRREPRLSNSQMIYSHQAPPGDDAAELALRDIIQDAHGEVMLGQLCALAEDGGFDGRRGFAALMRLSMEGVVELDLSQPLALSTLVTLGGGR